MLTANQNWPSFRTTDSTQARTVKLATSTFADDVTFKILFGNFAILPQQHDDLSL